MQILFEDNCLIVCIKPAGVLSQANSDGGESMLSLLSEHTKTEIYPIHRLDREVSGVMVYAKTKAAAAKLSREITVHRFKKQYIALIHGIPVEPEGTMRDLLFKDSNKNKSYVVKRPRKGVKEALLEYSLIKTVMYENMPYSLVSVRLHTGRTHQIRVQFASRKMPLVGDKKYGAGDNCNKIYLWSHLVGFTHPVTGEKVEYTSEPEDYFDLV